MGLGHRLAAMDCGSCSAHRDQARRSLARLAVDQEHDFQPVCPSERMWHLRAALTLPEAGHVLWGCGAGERAQPAPRRVGSIGVCRCLGRTRCAGRLAELGSGGALALTAIALFPRRLHALLVSRVLATVPFHLAQLHRAEGTGRIRQEVGAPESRQPCLQARQRAGAEPSRCAAATLYAFLRMCHVQLLH